MVQRVHLMIASSQRLFRERVAALLSSVDRFEVTKLPLPRTVGVVAEEQSVDLVLLDCDGNRGTDIPYRELVRWVRRAGAEVILMGMDAECEEALEAFEEGARGFVLKSATLSEFKNTIAEVLRGEASCPPNLAFALCRRLQALSREAERFERIDALQLTARELEILQLIALGYSNRKIADQLCLSIYTVKNHIHRIFGKLKVRRRSEAIVHAAERRWFPPSLMRSFSPSTLALVRQS